MIDLLCYKVACGISILGIPQDGMTDGCQMCTNLMGFSGVKLDFQISKGLSLDPEGL